MRVIVTDSSAYLTRGEAERLGVVVVPMTYSLGGAVRPESYEGENGDYGRLINRYTVRLHTAQASRAAFVSAFRSLVQAGSEVLCVTMSSRMSGTYGNAVFAAREVDPRKVRVVDSLSTAGGLAQLVMRARALLDSGLELEEAAQALEALREKVEIVFTVEDIEPLRRSGRIGSVKLSVSTILNIRPILRCVDGALVSSGIARGRSDQRRQLMQKLPQGIGRVVMMASDAREQADALAQALAARGVAVERRPLGPVLAIHLGTGAVGLSWLDD